MPTALTVNRTDLFRHLGRHLGLGPDYSAWSPSEQQDGLDILNRALRQFYNPDVLPGEGLSYRWSFLRPELRLTTQPNVGDYDLPEDFGGLQGVLTYASSRDGFTPVASVSESRIRQLRQAEQGATGYPEAYCIVPLSSNTIGQRWTLQLWPLPGSEWELVGRYFSNPYQITSAAPYPLGGQPHAETLIASVIAAADATLRDDPLGANYQAFLIKLKSSVSHDRQETQAKNLGYCGDGPDWDYGRYRTPRIAFNGLYADGTAYTGTVN